MLPNRYNVRVYGICIDADARLLVTDERRGDLLMTKFPGGGHQFGEGVQDTVIREFLEESGTGIEVLRLYYLNDFPQLSAFDPRDQLLSIYYLVRTLGPLRIAAREQKFDFQGEEGDCQAFRWIPVACIEPHEFTFPIDQEVARRLKRDVESRILLAQQDDLPLCGTL